METSNSLKKEVINIEQKLEQAVKSILKQFEIIRDSEGLPKEIILKNYGDYEYFKSFLERELVSNGYNIPVLTESDKEGYFIDVCKFMNLDKYP